MRLRHIQRRTAQLLAAIAVLALAFSPISASCPCALAAEPTPASCCDATVEPSCCCGEHCGTADAGCCCSTGDDAADGASQCECSVQANDSQAPAPTSPTRLVDVDLGAYLLPASVAALNSGINGASWSTAFDREAPGGPPGMQLHAYFSVWQI